MKNVLIRAAGIVAAGLIVAGGSVAYAAKQGTNKPLSVTDANGVFLGNLVKAPDPIDPNFGSGNTAFTVYNPQLDGLIEYEVQGIGTGGWQTMLFPTVGLYFIDPNCQGPAYTDAGLSVAYTPQWILAGMDQRYFRMGQYAGIITVASVNDSGVCRNVTDQPQIDGYEELTPVTFPAELQSPAWPITIN